MLLEDALHLFRRRVDRIAPRRLLKGHAKHVVARFGDNFVVVVFNLFFPLRRHIFLHGGKHKVGCALEYRDLSGGFRYLWKHLYSGGARTNDAHALARHVEPFWPSGRMKNRSLELVLPRVIGEHRLRNHAHSADKIFSGVDFSTMGADVPQSSCVVELGTLDFCAQLEHGPE